MLKTLSVLRALLVLALLGLATASSAGGEGSRLLLGPGAPQPAGAAPGPIERDAQRCDALRGDAKERCLRELRAAASGTARGPHTGSSLETTGAGSGATVAPKK